MADTVDRRRFLIGGAAGAAALAGGCAAFRPTARTERPPNVVYIMSDDQGYGDLGCYGSKEVDSPNIDRLARRGVRFTNYYAAAPVCTPTRCAFMTGRYPARAKGGLEYAIYCKGTTPIAAEQGLPPDEITIAAMLKKRGYATGLMGKWHLGYKKEFGPNAHGFDEFFGFKSGNINYFTHKEISGEPDLYENETPAEVDGYMTDLITARSVDFIDRHRGEPFFLAVMYNAPHWPWQGPDDADKPITPDIWKQAGDRATYVEMIERMDAGIGRIRAALERHRLERDTLVIFCSDNGGERFADNGPFSGAKRELWEGGIHVPAIVRWPGVLPRGETTAQQAITMDFSATILAAAGAQAPEGRELDGENLLPVLRGEALPHDRRFFWRRKNQKAALDGHWKYIHHVEKGEFLYDIARDFGETTNLVERYPDQLRRMRALMKEWEADVKRYQWRPGSRWEETFG